MALDRWFTPYLHKFKMAAILNTHLPEYFALIRDETWNWGLNLCFKFKDQHQLGL